MQKNNKVLKVISIILVVVGLAIIGVGVFLSFNKDKETVSDVSIVAQATENMKKLDGYKVFIKEYDEGKYEGTKEIHISNKGEFEYVVDEYRLYYKYKGNIFEPVDGTATSEKWYYSSSVHDEVYKDSFAKLYDFISNNEFTETENVFEYINKENTDSNKLTDIIYEIYNLGGTTTIISPEEVEDYDSYNVENLNIYLDDNNYFKRIIISAANKNCYEDDKEECEWIKTLDISFDEINEVATTMPSNVLDSANALKESAEVGKYKRDKEVEVKDLTITEINFTDSYDVDREVFSGYIVYECEDLSQYDYINMDEEGIHIGSDDDPELTLSSGILYRSFYYLKEDNTLKMYSFKTDELVYTFRLSENKLEQLDENNQVIDTFIKK